MMNVSPRYTSGSPRTVDNDVALRVAREEEFAYVAVLSGIYGDTEQRKAILLGLGGIVESLVGHQRRKSWYVTDIITKATHWRPFPENFERGGFVQLYVDSLGEYDSFVASDYDGTLWSFSAKFGGFTERAKFEQPSTISTLHRIPAYLAFGTGYPPAEGGEAGVSWGAAHAKQEQARVVAIRPDVPEL